MIRKFIVSRDDGIYEAFPDVALAPSGRLVCVFAECTHHHNRDYTRIMLTDSTDRGRSFTRKRPLTDALRGDPKKNPFWNCPRISTLSDGRLVVVVDRVCGKDEGNSGGEQSNWLLFSSDEGATWSGLHATPVEGIVPDKLIELKHGRHAGRWILSAHTVIREGARHVWHERCWLSDDRGANWEGPFVIAAKRSLKLCEGSVLELPSGELVCFMRENSRKGLDAFKAISVDGGRTWKGPLEFPMPGCHRPVAGMLRSGSVMITHRYLPGGRGGLGWWTQNTFAVLTDVESCLARSREEAGTRVLPLDFDRSSESDTGYTGWVQFDNGDIYVVNYLLDDAKKAQIRGYALTERDFILTSA